MSSKKQSHEPTQGQKAVIDLAEYRGCHQLNTSLQRAIRLKLWVKASRIAHNIISIEQKKLRRSIERDQRELQQLDDATESYVKGIEEYNNSFFTCNGCFIIPCRCYNVEDMKTFST